MSKDEPYHYVRFTWWGVVDVEGLQEEFEDDYDARLVLPPEDESKTSIHIKDVRELRVKADTLSAFLLPSRAVLSQKEKAPFTGRDLRLRERVLEIYPHSRPTPLPFMLGDEPEFEVEEP